MFVVAVAYSAVGHGGGSGYLAVMALLSVAPPVMKPAALFLNVLVASVGSIRYLADRRFSWSAFWPFAITSIPCAFIGGRLDLPARLYKQVMGVVLVYSAYRLWRSTSRSGSEAISPPPLPQAASCGAAIGFVSGMIGVGGGIFLSPLLILFRWAETRAVSGVSALFILVNSIAGLAGARVGIADFPPSVGVWAGAVLAGGLLGSWLGSRKLEVVHIRRLLGIVLLVAALKLLAGV